MPSGWRQASPEAACIDSPLRHSLPHNYPNLLDHRRHTRQRPDERSIVCASPLLDDKIANRISFSTSSELPIAAEQSMCIPTSLTPVAANPLLYDTNLDTFGGQTAEVLWMWLSTGVRRWQSASNAACCRSLFDEPTSSSRRQQTLDPICIPFQRSALPQSAPQILETSP